MPVQVSGEVLSLRRVGAYYAMTIVAPGVAEVAKPGQFVTIAVGGPDTGMLMRRPFSIAPNPRTRRLRRHRRDHLLGRRPRHLRGWRPARRTSSSTSSARWGGRSRCHASRRPACSSVAATAPLRCSRWPTHLRARGCRVDFVIGAAKEERLFGALDAKRISATLTVTTDDGSVGHRGWVSDVLPDVLTSSKADVVYACGPMAMLHAVSRIAEAADIPCQIAVEELMACGVGVCMTCVLPVIGDDGQTRMVRSCVDGPVFHGDRVRFDDIGTIPPDTVGAPLVPAKAAARAAVRTTSKDAVRAPQRKDSSEANSVRRCRRSPTSLPTNQRTPNTAHTDPSTSHPSAAEARR